MLKPVDGAGGAGIVIGPRATAEELDAVTVEVRANPRGWMAQKPVALSTIPVLVGEKLAPRHIDLRPFAVNDGSDVWVLPGGLTRVALKEGELKVNSSQGGGSKDTWVLDGGRNAEPLEEAVAKLTMALPEAASAPEVAAVGRQIGPDQ